MILEIALSLASDSAAELVFVNPGHADHLQKVIYRRDANGKLTAHRGRERRQGVLRGRRLPPAGGRIKPLRRAVDRAQRPFA